jgi:hypothetical protein
MITHVTEATANIAQLLDRVSKGEAIIISQPDCETSRDIWAGSKPDRQFFISNQR